MKRINVIGTTGSGKSTFSSLLSEKLGYPCIHMDQMFWKPDWVESSDEEFFPKLESAISEDCWVLDGNYSRTNAIKWRNVDTIIWLDYSYFKTLFQLLRRTLSRAITKEELWPETGNRESFRMAFASRHSIFLWFFRNYNKNRRRYQALLQSPEYDRIKFVHIRDPKQAQAFLEGVAPERR
ncbi:AAA domain-containing protein [Marinimicrobium koreense]|uniref:AAA domain-containing protein n=1 Tax=Marinimicrobium koreense TaxID=306545 RepID=A0A3N1NR82_9GAMM|nr:AAA domain-containing protein [Marinimicrobium koreense]